MEKLVCDMCNTEYTDKESIDEAKRQKDTWIEVCKHDGFEPRGICPCPDIKCKGELILKEV